MANEIKQYLESLVNERGYKITQKLEKGSRIQKSWGIDYEIDDAELYKKLGDFDEKVTVPYGPIHRSLNPSIEKTVELSEKYKPHPIPFSEIYNAGVGECLEKAVLTQLYAQNKTDSFLINRGIILDNDGCIMTHAFNIIFKENKPFLVDTENPLAKDSNGKLTPYVAPVTGIKEGGKIEVPKEWEQNREYYLY